MKMILRKILVIALAITTLFSSFACESFEEQGIIPGLGNSSSSTTKPSQPEMNDDPTDDFVVNVTLEGDPFPILDGGVVWRDVYSSDVFSAPLDKGGQARIDGLDGDYYVSLTTVPYGYAYDPNSYVATNDTKEITVQVHKIITPAGDPGVVGTGEYNCFNISKTGVYSATVLSADSAVFYQYAPNEPGEFSVESWVNVAQDYVNPSLAAYSGNAQWKQYSHTIDDGGTSGSYTMNFVHIVQMDDSNFSSGGGQASFCFAIKAESRNNKYPISVTFAIKRDGDFDYDDEKEEVVPAHMVIPTFDFTGYKVADHEYGHNNYQYLDKAHPSYPTNSNYRVFDDSNCKIWKKSAGGDDFYHLYDESKYADNNGWGPIIYAAISDPDDKATPKPFRFNAPAKSFDSIEYEGAKEEMSVTYTALKLGSYNYKLFIEGYAWLAKYGRKMQGMDIGSYYCVAECFCHNTADGVDDWACLKGCEDCHSSCSGVPADQYQVKGYADYTNSQGLVPVTEELKTFLTRYCESQGFFNDGSNLLTVNGKTYDAKAGSAWLYACCYF